MQFPKALNIKWLKRETKRDFLLPVSVAIASERLQAAFTSPISISKGFLFSKCKYTGSINGNELFVSFTVYGRSAMDYSMHGLLFTHPYGSRLEMTVEDQTPFFIYLVYCLFTTFFIFRGNWISNLLFFVFFTVLLSAVLAWHRNVATDNVSSLLLKIVTNSVF